MKCEECHINKVEFYYKFKLAEYDENPVRAFCLVCIKSGLIYGFIKSKAYVPIAKIEANLFKILK